MLSTKTHGPFSITRPPRDDDELHELVRRMWGVEISRAQVCPNHDSPFSWFADSFFARQPQTIALGSRGLSGKSYGMAALGLTQAVVLGSDVNILGGSMSQSQNLHSHMRNSWEFPSAPKYMIKDESSIQIALTNNALLRPLTASQKTVRGPHPARLLLDEVDEIKQEIFDAAKGQPMPQKNWLGVLIPAQTAMTSTLQYADGVMMKEMQRQEEQGMHTYSWCYRENLDTYGGWLSQEFVEQKKREIPMEMWRVEYELGEPSIGNRAFDTDSVERMFTLPTDGGIVLPEPVHLSKEREEYQIEAPNESHDYVISADWAKSQDYTVIGVWDATRLPMKLVYYIRVRRLPYPVMIGYFNTLQKKYRAQGIHDATGLGGVVSDLIEDRAWDFQMVGRQRDDMLSEFVAAVENDKVRAPRIKSFFDEVKYARVEDLYSRAEAQGYHLPDTVSSAALAWKIVGSYHPDVLPYGSPKADISFMGNAVEQNTQYLKEDSPWRLDGQVKSTSEDQSFFSMT